MQVRRVNAWGGAVALAAALIGAAGAEAQIAVAALDGKQPEAGRPATDRRPDAVVVIDLGAFPPRVIGTVQAPTSMIGPPASVAVARDSSFAIVTAAQKVDPADPGKLVPDDRVSVIDLADPRRPILVQTIAAGAGASGVSINRAGTLALVASAGEGTISIYSIARKRLMLAGKLRLDPELAPVDVAISPDGRTALVTQRRGQAMLRLAIDGAKVTDTGISYPAGGNPFAAVFGRDGRYAYNTNLLGRLPPPGAPPPSADAALRIGTVSVIDPRTDRIVNMVEVGPMPEHLSLSPDGRYLAVTLVNGSSGQPGAPGYNPFGFLKIYRVKGANLTQVAEARTGRLGQGSTWSKDGRTILLQTALEHRIEVYRFDGKRLRRHGAALTFETRPGAIATALDR